MSPGRHDGQESLMKRRTGQTREAEDKFHMSAGGVAGNGGSPAGRINAAPRINAALEKAPHFRKAEINSSRGY